MRFAGETNIGLKRQHNEDSFFLPDAERLGDRLITAPDPVALGPELARRLHGGELVVLKASRGVALERILPFLAVSPTPAPEV